MTSTWNRVTPKMELLRELIQTHFKIIFHFECEFQELFTFRFVSLTSQEINEV
jgi:hypothetical protein